MGCRGKDLKNKILRALHFYPCDILFVHRDAEKEPSDRRREEILLALSALKRSEPYVCVVPVRMTEAWLLFDEGAIRRASGNRNGKQPLMMPNLPKLEELPDPKEYLTDLLRHASGLTGRRLKDLNLSHAASQVALGIGDFSPLRSLSAFRKLEEELAQVLPLPKVGE